MVNFFQESEKKKSSVYLVNMSFSELNLFRATATLQTCSLKHLKGRICHEKAERYPLENHFSIALC